MAAYIGAVTFPYPLKWINKARPVVLGSDTRTRAGDIVSIEVDSADITQDRSVTLAFEWVPWTTVEALYSMWMAGGTYTLDPEDTGDTYTVRFQRKNGVTVPVSTAFGQDVVKAQLDGEETDLYDGELNLIIVG